MRVQGYRRGAVRSFVLHLLVLSAFIGIFLSPFHAEGADTATLIVKLHETLSVEEQAQVIARDGGERTSSIPALRLHIVRVPTVDLPLILQNYSNDPQVASVEVGRSRRAEGVPTDIHYGVQWALGKIGWDRIFGAMTPAGSARIALLDTGIDASHPDLSGSVLPGRSMLVSGGDGLTDPNGHGTALAGIIAAVANNELGIAGVAYQGVSVIPVTVLAPSGMGEDSDIIAGIVWAADNGADVILMGFSNEEFSPSLQAAIDYAWSKGAVLVAATGSGGLSAPTYPAGSRGVIGVSATDETDLLAAGSNYGASTFLAAPGTNILTTSIDGTYSYISGTSASSAFVAAVAGFMKASDPALTNGVIVGRLARSADAVGAADDPENQAKFGNGRVNMARAVADTSTDAIQPAGAAPVASGGPYVGPYAAASYAGNVTVEQQEGEITYGTGGSATYLVTVRPINQGNFETNLSIGDLPDHVTGTFSPYSLSGHGAKTSILTLTSGPAAAAGTYQFTVTASAPESVAATGTLSVRALPLIIKADDRTKKHGEEILFGPDSQHFTATGLANGDTIASVDLDCAGGSSAAEPGTYPITPKNATGSFYPRNYSISYQSGTLTVVAKTTATVTLGNLAQVYTGQALTPTVTTVPPGLGITWTNAPQTNAGTYQVTATVQSAEYAGSASGAFTISRATQSITFDKPADQQYGAGPFILSAGATSSLAVGFESKTTPVCTVSGNEVTIVGLGTCIIEATQPGSMNFYAATPVQHSFTVTSGALDHFAVTVDASPKTAGQPFTASITALDRANNIIQDFSGTANLTTTAGSVLPPVNVALSGGTWTGTVTVTGAGPEKSVTVTDPASGKTGSSINFEVLPGQAAAFSVSAPASAVAGQALTVTVTAKDLYDNVASGYLGKVKLTSDFPGAALPAEFTFDANDGGSHTFAEEVTFFAALVEKVTATDNSSGISGFSNSIEVSPAGATELLVVAPSTAAAGSPFDVTVTVMDAFDNTITNYEGTVTFTSDDPNSSALLPAAYTFLPEDRGSHTFGGLTSLTTSGMRTVSAADTSSPSIAGRSGSIRVTAGAAAHISIETAADGSGLTVGAQSVTAGDSVTGYAVTRDRYQNYVANVAAAWSLETADRVAGEDLVPAQDATSATFTGKGVGTATIVAASDGLQGRSGLITVTPAALDHFALSALGTPLTLGTSVSLTITAEDAFGNIVEGFSGSADLAVSGGSAVSPTRADFSNGSWRGLVTITGAGTGRFVTATRSGGNESGRSNAFDVEKAGQTIQMGVVGTRTYGAAPFQVTAQGGASGNPVTFTAAPESVCEISGATVTINGAGTCELTASQAGSETYLPAPEVRRTFTVSKGNQTIAFTPIPEKSTSAAPFALSATSSSGQQVLFQLVSGPATINGDTVTISGTPGTIVLRAYLAESANYNAVHVDQSVAVTAAVVKCAAPGRLTVPATSTGSVYIYWTASSTPNVTYVVDQQSVGGSWSNAVYSGTKNYATILVPAQGSYTFRVKATRSDLQGSDYSTSATVCSVTLGAPKNLTVPATSNGPIYIYWTASPTTGASYILEQNRDGAGWTSAYEGTKTNVSLVVTAKGSYAFRVKAERAGFEDSSYAVTNNCSVTMGPPRNLVVPASSNGSLYIYWGASATAGATYTLEKSLNGGSWSTAYTGTSNNATVTVTAQGSYLFRVKAYHAEFGESAYATAAACNVTLGAPSNLVVPASSAGAIYIYWKASATTGAQYVLQKSSDGTNWGDAYTGSSNYATVNVDTSGSYHFRVKATHANFDASGYATCTTVCNVTVP